VNQLPVENTSDADKDFYHSEEYNFGGTLSDDNDEDNSGPFKEVRLLIIPSFQQHITSPHNCPLIDIVSPPLNIDYNRFKFRNTTEIYTQTRTGRYVVAMGRTIQRNAPTDQTILSTKH
ncbi:10378_t:CDS:2, partial [Acaulospora colombiana]